MLLKDINVGQYIKFENGDIYKVVCNDWWDDGKLRDFICIDAAGHKKHYGFLDETATINVKFVNNFEQVKTCEKCGHIQK